MDRFLKLGSKPRPKKTKKKATSAPQQPKSFIELRKLMARDKKARRKASHSYRCPIVYEDSPEDLEDTTFISPIFPPKKKVVKSKTKKKPATDEVKVKTVKKKTKAKPKPKAKAKSEPKKEKPSGPFSLTVPALKKKSPQSPVINLLTLTEKDPEAIDVDMDVDLSEDSDVLGILTGVKKIKPIRPMPEQSRIKAEEDVKPPTEEPEEPEPIPHPSLPRYEPIKRSGAEAGLLQSSFGMGTTQPSGPKRAAVEVDGDALVVPAGQDGCLDGITLVVTGVLECLDRDGIKDYLKRLGARVTGGVSSKTTYLVTGSDPGQAKVTKARTIGTTILNEADLYALVESHSKQAAKKVAKKVVARPRTKRTVPPRSTVPVGPELWADKYTPRASRDLVGNKLLVQRVTAWLNNWRRVHIKGEDVSVIAQEMTASVRGKPGQTFNFEDMMSKRALLFAGQPGIGKTTVATLVARETGHHLVERNASDARSLRSVRDDMAELFTVRSIDSFFSKKKTKKKQGEQRTVVVMDECDGMDAGGLPALCKTIHTTKTPIICICNDKLKPKMKTLRKTAYEFVFRRPSALDVGRRISSIAKAEGISIPPNAATRLGESSHGDIRHAIQELQLMATTTDSVTFKHAADSCGAEVAAGPFEMWRDLFAPPGRGVSLSTRLSYAYDQHFLMPHGVFENYITRSQPLAVAADVGFMMSLGDCICGQMRTGDWSAGTAYGLLGTVLPSSSVASQVRQAGYGAKYMFPGSTKKAEGNRNIARDISGGLGSRRGCRDAVGAGVLDIPILKDMIETLWMNEQRDEALHLLETFDIDHVRWTDLDGLYTGSLKGAKKGAFTRAMKKSVHRAGDVEKLKKTNRKAKRK